MTGFRLSSTVLAAPDDRLGVRASIIERMRRHGGSATVRSTPGSGTEVRLAMPRQPRESEPGEPQEESP